MRIAPLVFLLAAGCTAHAGPVSDEPIKLSDKEAAELGAKIWQNEAGGKKEALVWWNQGEGFASMGIAHFIWFPAGHSEIFDETFPKLLVYLEQNGVALPAWLKGGPPCPWPDRDSFEKDLGSPRVAELRTLLESTISWQARWVADRLEKALPKMLEGLSPSEQSALQSQFYRIARSPGGFYALIDYLNFKGDGVSTKERYNGYGWGLLQVLQEMSGSGSGAVDEFSAAAEKVLRRRVQNSPPERNEARWLPTWLKRVQTYRAG